MRRTIISISAVFTFLLFVAASFGYYNFTHRVEGDFFESNGLKIHYKVEGEGEPVVLLHGFAVNADLNWRNPGITELLSKDYKVITMDNRGHGLSDKPHDDQSYGRYMVDDVINLLDHLQIEKAHLVGYSMGGFISLKCASLYPERWISVVPMASGWEDPETSSGVAALKEASEDLRAGKSIGPVISYFDEHKEPGILHTYWVKILTTWFNDKEALYALILASTELMLTEEELSRIELPVCSIVGSDDPFLKSAKAMEGVLPNLELVILDGENHITTPRTKKSKQTLVDFLSRHASQQL